MPRQTTKTAAAAAKTTRGASKTKAAEEERKRAVAEQEKRDLQREKKRARVHRTNNELRELKDLLAEQGKQIKELSSQPAALPTILPTSLSGTDILPANPAMVAGARLERLGDPASAAEDPQRPTRDLRPPEVLTRTISLRDFMVSSNADLIIALLFNFALCWWGGGMRLVICVCVCVYVSVFVLSWQKHVDRLFSAKVKDGKFNPALDWKDQDQKEINRIVKTLSVTYFDTDHCIVDSSNQRVAMDGVQVVRILREKHRYNKRKLNGNASFRRHAYTYMSQTCMCLPSMF